MFILKKKTINVNKLFIIESIMTVVNSKSTIKKINCNLMIVPLTCTENIINTNNFLIEKLFIHHI